MSAAAAVAHRGMLSPAGRCCGDNVATAVPALGVPLTPHLLRPRRACGWPRQGVPGRLSPLRSGVRDRRLPARACLGTTRAPLAMADPFPNQPEALDDAAPRPGTHAAGASHTKPLGICGADAPLSRARSRLGTST
eukprot:CAMPEP_0180395742 /NCGR_PEP_ID=MMETSP0989-20121125/35055_1 /TAXON_ID=697907 /ORGANISM="non described non described, Strain CCMP2293" /LENGTH=135 /DNA_ID=CAMNT_0022397933 /DNA_START=32 /DNA_END=435 /DNA_ORIENTATION=+